MPLHLFFFPSSFVFVLLLVLIKPGADWRKEFFFGWESFFVLQAVWRKGILPFEKEHFSPSFGAEEERGRKETFECLQTVTCNAPQRTKRSPCDLLTVCRGRYENKAKTLAKESRIAIQFNHWNG